jgi:hypothetical protein
LFFVAAAGGADAAGQAARAMIAAHGPANEDELALAAEIVQFSMLALDAAAQSLGPDLTDAKALCLRNAAVRFHKQAHAARRALARLRQPAKPLAAGRTFPEPAAPDPAAEADAAAPAADPAPLPAPAKPRAPAPRHQMTKAEMLARMQETSLRMQAAAAAVAAPLPHVRVSA